MSILHYDVEDPGPTGRFSWPKFWGSVVITASPAPIVLSYLEVGPDAPWWAPMVFTLFIALLGVGLRQGKLSRLFDRVSDAGIDRLGGDDD